MAESLAFQTPHSPHVEVINVRRPNMWIGNARKATACPPTPTLGFAV